MTKRDNFDKNTIVKTAAKVGYRCCFPGCNKFCSASSHDDKLINIGVACHITAAAPGGPRYDANITPEERKNGDNLIWMCQTHSKIIDSDSERYTVEVLRSYKKIKEQEVYEELISTTFYEKNDLDTIKYTFDCLIKTCDFKLLNEIINNYKTFFGFEIDELVLRYKCISYIYTENKKYENAIKDYIDKTVDKYYDKLEEIICIAIELCSINSLKLIYNNLNHNSKFKKEVEKLICQEGLKKFLSLQVKPFDKVDIFKLLINYNLLFERTYALDEKGNILPLPSYEEAYYKIINQVFSLQTILEENYSTVSDQDCIWLISQMKNIMSLRTDVKNKIISYILRYLTFCKSNKFITLYNQLELETKHCFDIYQVKIFNDLYNQKLNVDELIEFTNKFSDFNLLLLYLQKLSNDKRIEFLDEYKYLLKKDTTLFYIYYKDRIITEIELNDINGNDLNKNILLYKNNIDKVNSLNVICKNLSLATYFNIDDVITIILSNKKNQDLIYFLSNVRNVNELHSILTIIIDKINLSDKQLIDSIIEMIDTKLLDDRNRDLLIDRANFYRTINKLEAAKKDFIEAYFVCREKSLLEYIVNLKFSTKDFNKDALYEDILDLNTPESRAYLGNVHYNKYEYDVAKVYYLDAYLMGYQQDDISRVIFEMQIKTESKLEYIKDNSIAILSNDEEYLTLVFLKEYKKNLNYINNDKFKVISLTGKYSNLKFSKINSSIMFDNEEWKIDKVFDIYEYLASKGLENLLKNLDTKTFSIGEPNDPIKEIREYMIKLDQTKKHDLDDIMTNPMKISFNYVSRYFNTDYVQMLESIRFKYGINNNINYLLGETNIKLLVSAEEVYILYKFKDYFDYKFDRLFLTREIYNYYKDLCCKNIVELDDDNHMIGVVHKGNFVIVKNTIEDKKSMNILWNDFNSFLDQFNVLDKIDLELGCFENVNKIDSLYASILNFRLKDNSYGLLTDDSFLKNCSDMLKFRNIGLASLFIVCGKIEKLEEFIKEMYNFGFSYYINIDLFLKLQNDEKLCNDILHNDSNYFEEEKHLKLIALNFAISSKNSIKLNTDMNIILNLLKSFANE